MFKNLCPGAVGIKASFEEAVKLAKDNGFQGLDLYLDAAKQMGAAKVKDIYAKAELKMGTGVPCPDFRKDDETFKKGLATLPESAKLAVACGCTRCATWIMPASDELTFAENFKQHAQRLREVARILKVSLPTATRDLKLLCAEGFIRKIEPKPAPRTHYFQLNADGKAPILPTP